MIVVHVCIAQGVNKLSRLEVGDVGDHVSEKGVACNVERYPEAQIGRALVQLARQLALGDIKLKEILSLI
jgi:hypothetical protein